MIADLPQGGNPGDDGLLAGAITKAKRAGMRVDSVLADRGFGTRIADQALREHDIKRSVIPRRGRAAPIEATPGWRRRYRFRNGLRGRISQLKRNGLRRTRLRALPGAQTWIAGNTLAHNLQRMAILTRDLADKRSPRANPFTASDTLPDTSLTLAFSRGSRG